MEPDVPSSAEGALDTAMELARLAAEQYRDGKERAFASYARELRDLLTLVETTADEDPDQAERMMTDAMDSLFEHEMMNRYFFLELADSYLATGNPAMAIIAAKQVTRHYPRYLTPYPKLVEGYLALGDSQGAIQTLKKISELDPNDAVTRRRLEELER